MTDRNASLVLKTSDLTVGGSNQFGSCDANRTTMTWNNINLRSILGDMYDDYDYFNLCLNQITTAYVTTLGAGNDDRNVLVNIAGLPWINQCYSVSKGHSESSTVIASLQFQINNFTTQYFYSNNLATFGKNQELCNITISYSKVLDNALPAININYFPQTVFVFDIYGINKFKNEEITNRMVIKRS